MKRFRLFATPVVMLGLALSLSGCIGTDFVAETVDETAEARIEITPLEQAVMLGEDAHYDATYYGADGQPDASVVLTWTSSNPAIASIAADGTVTPQAIGQVEVHARAGDIVSTTATLTVVADLNQVARVSVDPDTLVMMPGDTQALTASAFNLNDAPLAVSAIIWASTDPAIATVDDQGSVVAVMPGTSNVTATIDGVASPNVLIRVLGQERTGTFTARAGTNYDVQGSVTLQEQSNGTVVVRFGSDFRTDNGPGLAVYLSTVDGVTSSSINLGNLKSTLGEQSYVVTQEIDLNRYRWVIIHCVPFNVTFGSANLR